jgi:hypothetical protein
VQRRLGTDEMDELAVVDLASGALSGVAATERLRGVTVAPGGRRVAAYATGAGPIRGLFVVELDTGAVAIPPGELFGAYRWRDGERLLIVPMNPGPRHQLLEFVPAEGETRDLAAGSGGPFKIAGGDWSVSPDGRYIAWLEASDRALWARRLPN